MLLSFPINDREEDPKKFINEIKFSILEVREHAPETPLWIISKYNDTTLITGILILSLILQKVYLFKNYY